MKFVEDIFQSPKKRFHFGVHLTNSNNGQHHLRNLFKRLRTTSELELSINFWSSLTLGWNQGYTQTWNSAHFPKQHINCMGRYAFRKSVQSVQKIVKQHGDAIPNMLLSMCSNHDFYQFISSKQHGDAWLKKVQKHLGFINKKVQNTMGRTSLA